MSGLKNIVFNTNMKTAQKNASAFCAFEQNYSPEVVLRADAWVETGSVDWDEGDLLKNILVTGASGFVGVPLCAELLARGSRVRGVVRALHSVEPASGVEYFTVGNLTWQPIYFRHWRGRIVWFTVRLGACDERDRSECVGGVSVVNVDGSLRLAEQAAAAGAEVGIWVRLRWMGNRRCMGRRFCFRMLRRRRTLTVFPNGKPSRRCGRWWWIRAWRWWVRPPLVYGLGAKGNLARLTKLVRSGVPLPLVRCTTSARWLG